MYIQYVGHEVVEPMPNPVELNLAHTACICPFKSVACPIIFNCIHGLAAQAPNLKWHKQKK